MAKYIPRQNFYPRCTICGEMATALFLCQHHFYQEQEKNRARNFNELVKTEQQKNVTAT